MKNCENSIESWAKGAIVGRNYKKVTPNPTKDLASYIEQIVHQNRQRIIVYMRLFE